MRTPSAVFLILSAVVLAAPAANADFHPVCTGSVIAYASVGLEAGSDGYYEFLEYIGTVHCPDAVVTVTELELLRLPSGSQLDNTTGGCVSGLAQPCDVRDRVYTGRGSYEVRMIFDVDDPATDGVDYVDVPRYARFEWTGVGQPVPTCTSIGFFPVYAGC